MPDFIRAYREGGDAGQAGDPIRFIASTEGIARDGMVIESGAWQLDNFRKNPIVLWGHDYLGSRLPIGRASVDIDGKRLLADVTFDQQDEFAMQVESKYRRGFLNAVSVGWNTKKVEPGTPPKIKEAELLDVSAVPVGGDPDALVARQARALLALGKELEGMMDRDIAIDEPRRGAIPPHSTEKMPEDTDWNGPAEVAQMDGEAQLRQAHAWVDDEQDPDTKQAYKLPHHQASGEVVWRGVAAAMARLLQAGTQIPDEDRRGVYNHLARHYRQFDREPPEFRTAEEIEVLDPEQVRGLFLEGEPEIDPGAFRAQRAGAVLSGRNRDALVRAMELIQGVLDSAKPKEQSEDEERAEPQDDQVLVALHRLFTKVTTTQEVSDV